MSEQPTKPIDDGGPAFSCPGTADRSLGPHNEGMSLRDYLAAHADPREVYGDNQGDPIPTATAMALVGRPRPNYDADPLGNAAWWSEATARWKYMHADHMLAARKAVQP